MPWSRNQMRVAQAVKHCWQPTGKAKGFTMTFAAQVIEAGVRDYKRKKGMKLGGK